jgi:hypothetical protein
VEEASADAESTALAVAAAAELGALAQLPQAGSGALAAVAERTDGAQRCVTSESGEYETDDGEHAGVTSPLQSRFEGFRLVRC